MRRLLLAAFLCGTAHADPVATYAIVVGSNTGGPGQAELRYAEDDARRVGQLLVELGGFAPEQVDVVVHPTPEQLRERLARLGERVRADVAGGRQSRVVFYYSGHARAQAIDLGVDELPLSELRARLFEVPATLTVVVLDACQSGAFSRVKGAQPAADFSWSSRQHLDATGVAVLASSSASELSQESRELRSSYFTHHLLVGLRGAGDANGDGQVTIDEAYRYAYHQTLLATAATAVGGQHATFEADLKGHGEIALTFPRAANSWIELPGPLEGQTLVEDKRARVVVAETYKAKGAPVRIAVTPGEYDVLVRRGDSLSRCGVASGVVDVDHCRTEALRAEPAKGGWPRVQVEVGLGIGAERHDAYTDNLVAFGFDEGSLAVSAGLELVGIGELSPRIWVGGLASTVSMPQWDHKITGVDLHQTFDWSTSTLGAIARGYQPLADDGLASRISGYAQIVAGLGIGHTTFTDSNGMKFRHTDLGPSFALGGGLHLGRLQKGVGVSIGYELSYAPVIKDLIGNTHASGGSRCTFAMSYTF
jgi:hypothetical protein